MGFKSTVRLALASFCVSLFAACSGGSIGSNVDPGDGGGDGGGGGGGNNPPPVVVGAPSDLLVETAQLSIIADGISTALITATLLDDQGSPIPGETLVFETSAGELRTVDNSATAGSVVTSAQGRAQVRLRSPLRPTQATVTARHVSGLTSGAVVSFTNGPLVTLSELVLSPTTVAPGNSTSVLVRALDANNNPVPGEILIFDSSSNVSGGRFSQSTATSDANGFATTQYTAGETSGTDTLRVQGGDGVAPQTLKTANLTVAAATVGVVRSIVLTTGATTVATGEGPISVRATVADSNGNPIPGLPIRFQTSGGTLSSDTATTSGTGVAEVSLIAPEVTGSVRLTAATSGFITETTIEVVPGAADASRSIIAATPSAIIANGISTSEILVVLNDRFGNPLPDETVVRVSTSSGFLLSTSAALADGRAVFTLRSQAQPGVAQVSVVGFPTLVTPVTFEAATSGNPASIRFSAAESRISVVGVGQQEQTIITVRVLDSTGNPIRESIYGDPTLNNLRAQFVTRPNGGESLAGIAASEDIVTSAGSNFVDVRTIDGVANLNLRSGIRSGIVQVRFLVLDSDGSDFGVPGDVAAIAALPQVSIAGGPPHTLVFTQPVTNAIENLGNGNYRRRGKVDVTDRYGNSVPDGTVVNFQLMDSVILHDSTASLLAGDATVQRTGNSLIRRRCANEPLIGGEASGCGFRGALSSSSSFLSTITRNDVPREIQIGDQILIRNAPSDDKQRVVASVTNATELEAHVPYLAGLTSGEIWVGASLSGAQIAGLSAPDPETNEQTLRIGTGVVKDGIAEFRVTYPANVGSILSGCYGYPYADRSYDDRDRRSSVPQSRQVVVAANAGESVAALDVGNYCFAAIAGGSITPQVSDIAIAQGSFVDIGLTVRDAGGDPEDGGGGQVRLPYVPVACFLSDFLAGGSDLDPDTVFALDIDVLPNSDGFQETDVNGVAVVRLSNVGDDTGAAIVTCTNGDATTTIGVRGT